MTVIRKTSRLLLNCFNSPISIARTGNLKLTSLYKRQNSTVCWKCGLERTSPRVFCEKCDAVQAPPQSDNYFKVFDMPEKFHLDQSELRNKFRELQSFLHPDKFSNRTDEEQTISAEYSSLLNKAYSNLQAPLQRAEHLLKLKGESIEEDQSVDDPKFLMTVMELNEEVENAGDDSAKLKELNAKNKAEVERILEEIDGFFKMNDIQAAKLSIVKLKYFNSLSKRINATLRELGQSD